MSRKAKRYINNIQYARDPYTTFLYDKRGYLGCIVTKHDQRYAVLLMRPFGYIKKLAREFNNLNVRVLLQTEYTYRTKKAELKILKRISKFAQDDVKTAVMVGELKTELDKVVSSLYAYNQTLPKYEKVLHAEQVLLEYLVNTKYETKQNYWLTLLEPCYKCLRGMVDFKETKLIEWVRPHKEKWNTKDYLRLKELESIKYRQLRSKI